MISADVYPRVFNVLDLLSKGKTQTAACDEAGLTVATFKKYIDAAPELHEAFDNATQRGYDAMADSLVDIEGNGLVWGITDPKLLSIVSRNIQWFLSRKAPRQYGERVIHEHNITADRAIIEALSRGRERALSNAPMIEIEAKEVPSNPLLEQAMMDGIDTELLQFI